MHLFRHIALVLAGCFLCYGSLAQSVQANVTTSNDELSSTDWHVRCAYAYSLAYDHSKVSFDKLLILLRDAHQDVSNAAADAIEARGDSPYAADLLVVIPEISRERRGPAYRALRNYHDLSVLHFLTNALEEEMSYYRNSTFDGINCYYISTAITQLINSSTMMPLMIKMTEVDENRPINPDVYLPFLNQAKQIYKMAIEKENRLTGGFSWGYR